MPVTGVSPEGVKMYCEWLSTEMNKNHPDSKVKGVKYEWSFRLPTDSEWYYACAGGKLSYPMVFDTAYYNNSPTWQNDSTPNFGVKIQRVGDGFRNPFGLIYLEGNAREMIVRNDSTFFAGGSYGFGSKPISYCHYDNLELADSEKVYKADVGFRVVVTYLGGNPPSKIIVK